MRFRVMLAFLYVCSLFNNNNLYPSDFDLDKTRSFFESTVDVSLPEGHVSLSVFASILGLLQAPPTSIFIISQSATVMGLFVPLKISKGPGFAKFLKIPRRAPKSRGIPSVVQSTGDDDTLSIPTLRQSISRMAAIYTLLQGVV